ncbi:hypothetical protein D3C80_1122180 [compost metagenome]
MDIVVGIGARPISQSDDLVGWKIINVVVTGCKGAARGSLHAFAIGVGDQRIFSGERRLERNGRSRDEYLGVGRAIFANEVMNSFQ